MTAPWEKYLQKIYYDPANPISFAGPRRLYDFIQKDKKFALTHAQIKKWIQNQESYSRNKNVRRKFQRGKVIVSGIDDQFDADLASFIPYGSSNDDYKYLLAVIDIFSRYAWVEPLKSKKANEIIAAFNRIISQGRKPQLLRTDAATDFTSTPFQKYVKSKK